VLAKAKHYRTQKAATSSTRWCGSPISPVRVRQWRSLTVMRPAYGDHLGGERDIFADIGFAFRVLSSTV